MLLVRQWPDDVRILWQGGDSLPPEILDLSAGMLYEAESPDRAEMERLREELEETRRNAPRTISAAVERLLDELPPDQRRIVRSTPEHDLIEYHHGWGTAIRNAWVYGNAALMRDSGLEHPDDVSQSIIHAVWRRLQDEDPD